MARLLLRPAAKADLIAISEYTRGRWGAAKALEYVAELEACCRLTAERPDVGRVLPSTHYRRMDQGSHAVFYSHEPEAGEVVIVRILHQRMRPDLHLGDDE